MKFAKWYVPRRGMRIRKCWRLCEANNSAFHSNWMACQRGRCNLSNAMGLKKKLGNALGFSVVFGADPVLLSIFLKSSLPWAC